MKPYTVKVGPYTHLIHSDGHHEVISKEAKQPQAYYWDKEGCIHITSDLARDLQPEPTHKENRA